MITWLMDTPLLKMLAPEKAKPLLDWCDANDASLFISAASLAHVARGIDKLPTSQSRGAEAHSWLDRIIDRFGDRVHPVDARARFCRAAPLVSRSIIFTTSSSSRRLRGTATAWSPAEIRSSGPGLMLRLRSFRGDLCADSGGRRVKFLIPWSRLAKAGLQIRFTAIVYNIKRCSRILAPA
jgi:hypothetical protein